ncbi:PspA/IM30 family-domain-containing protein [Dunaliella salina]|uniref:PspA/IM30 family-domain-containing protein n=1 Tax=Dunaliella salina TaxID=3046 RepID=A0ABQ7H3E7_DUNSA|nr:PspA/IM30 family-domain-containing protein [Dunaliella salina]|eukprot:KAF5841356.1 PspA/IM30 family-domain-containing protein [Dunaliella salina]
MTFSATMMRSQQTVSGRVPGLAPTAPRQIQRRCRPVRGPNRSRRANVVTQANLFSRVARLFQSYANNFVSSAEDPEKLLDQVTQEMQGDLIRMRQAAAQVMASQKQMEAKYKQAQSTADDWLRRAELAVQKNEDELAKEALRRRKSYQENADSMLGQLEAQKKAVDQLLGNTRVLENKLAEAKSKKDTLKARSASAKTSKQIQEMIGSLDTSSSVAAFDKMEEKVMQMEAESESTQVLVAGDNLESSFAKLESGTVDDELAALKKGAIKSSAPAGALPPGQGQQGQPAGKPIKDAFDLELDELRKKARE